MRNASELKAIAMAEAHRKAAENREKSLDYLKTHIYPEMEENAADGFMYASFYLEIWVDEKVIIDELTANGYTYNKNGRSLKVYWM